MMLRNEKIIYDHMEKNLMNITDNIKVFNDKLGKKSSILWCIHLSALLGLIAPTVGVFYGSYALLYRSKIRSFDVKCIPAAIITTSLIPLSLPIGLVLAGPVAVVGVAMESANIFQKKMNYTPNFVSLVMKMYDEIHISCQMLHIQENDITSKNDKITNIITELEKHLIVKHGPLNIIHPININMAEFFPSNTDVDVLNFFEKIISLQFIIDSHIDTPYCLLFLNKLTGKNKNFTISEVFAFFATLYFLCQCVQFNLCNAIDDF